MCALVTTRVLVWWAVAQTVGQRIRLAIIWAVVSVVAFLRATPYLVWEEPTEFWARVPTMPPLSYLVEPWAGYLQLPARATFLVAHAVDSVTLTRILGAVVVGLVAAFLASDRLAPAVPGRRVRLAFALSLALLPVAEPYVGPLNAQWWLALFLVGMVLTTERRWWDYPAIAFAGLSGVGACLALPLFRDRRGLVLLGVCTLQGASLIAADRRPGGLGVSWQFATKVRRVRSGKRAVSGATRLAGFPTRCRGRYLEALNPV